MCLHFADLQKLVTRQHIVLKHVVKNIQDRLDIIMNMQEKLHNKLYDCTFVDCIIEDSFDNIITRVDKDIDLYELED